MEEFRIEENFGINTVNILALNLFDIVLEKLLRYSIILDFLRRLIFKSFFLFLKNKRQRFLHGNFHITYYILIFTYYILHIDIYILIWDTGTSKDGREKEK